MSNMRFGALLLLGSLCCLPIAEIASAQRTDEGSPQTSLSVARFSGDKQGSGDLPPISELLASRIAAAPIRVVPPDQFGELPDSIGSDAEALVAWAESAGTDFIVTGQVLRLGETLSVHTRLRSGKNGETLETFVEEMPRDAGRIDGIGALGTRLVAGIERASGLTLVAGNDASGGEEGDGAESSLRVGDSDEPISVNSGEMEVIPGRGGGRRFVFTKDVQAVQGGMRLQADRLEAVYPAGESEPDRFEATGNVRMKETRRGGEERWLLCDEAVFHKQDERLVCTGGAELREGGDRVRGNEIEINFAADRVFVRGGANLNLSGQ